jgi:putative FmdB family regulatory protein
MPIYEYQCKQCGHELERLQKMSDEPLRDCPVCEKPELHRLISAAAFRLKGGGWYETDFKKDNKRNLADSGSESPAATNGASSKADAEKPARKETTTSESKTASKSESSTA